MEEVQYPKSLIFPASEIKIDFENKSTVNRTQSSIIIEGNPNGFLSFSNIINVYSAYLYDPIVVTQFPFVQSSLKFEIIEDDNLFVSGFVIKESASHFKWKISEINLCQVICHLHSLGYANKELHFDTDLQVSDISVYCVIK